MPLQFTRHDINSIEEISKAMSELTSDKATLISPELIWKAKVIHEKIAAYRKGVPAPPPPPPPAPDSLEGMADLLKSTEALNKVILENAIQQRWMFGPVYQIGVTFLIPLLIIFMRFSFFSRQQCPSPPPTGEAGTL